MLVDLIIIALGAALGGTAVGLRKKLGREWMISLLCGALLVCGVGGVFAWASWQDEQEARMAAHIALRYLEDRDTDSAAYHLKKAGMDSFAANGARALLETMRGNTILAQVKQDALSGMAKGDEQRGIAERLKSLDPSDSEGQQKLTSLLRGQTGLSKRGQEEAERRYAAESGRIPEGMDPSELESGGAESLRTEVNRCLRNGSYDQAVRAAARLVRISSSPSNRLLLAETVAEAVYNGVYLSGAELSDAENPEDTGEADSAAGERESLQEKIDKLREKEDTLQLRLDGETDEEKRKDLGVQVAEATEERQELEQKRDYLFARRAMNAIADQHSLSAAVVRAKLRFAMQDSAGAVDVLRRAAASPSALLTSDSGLRNALHLLNQAYREEGSAGTQSPEFREAMTTLLSGGGNGMISAATSRLTDALTTYIMSDQKSYGRDLYSKSVDTSNYPEVVVTLSGRDTIMEQLLSVKDIIVRDTRTEIVSYTVKKPDVENAHMNICCVVDESGSMSGQPTRDLCAALEDFIPALGRNISIGIVGFENGYTIHAPVSENHMEAKAAVSQIHASGGTNITQGIIGAMEALADCAGRKTILLMTDGQSSIDMDVVNRAAAEGSVIHTIGFGGVNDELLTQIAEATGGQYIKATDSSELVNIYMSLIGLIGNEVEIRYTVTEQVEEERMRYFFVRIPRHDVELRVEYRVPVQQTPAIQRIYPAVLFSDTVSEASQNGRTLGFDLYGELSGVTGVSIGGAEAQITGDPSSGYLRAEIPATLSEGWQTVTLRGEGIPDTDCEKMVFVGDALESASFVMNDLALSADKAALSSDGQLVLGEYVSLRDGAEDGGEQTLSVALEGSLCIPVDAAALRRQLTGNRPNTVTLRMSGSTAEGCGLIRLNSEDSGNLYGADPYIIRGRFTASREGGQLRLIQN